MMAVSRVHDLGVAASSWKQVFFSNNPFGWPFSPAFTDGGVFHPTDGLHLTRVQYTALMRALGIVGERGFFVSIVESEGWAFLDRSWGHWWLEAPDYDEYTALDLTLENALYSERGQWGVLVSHEMHGVVGGTKQFVDAVSRGYGDWQSDARSLQAAWATNPNSGWIQSLPDFVRRASGG